MTAPKEQFATSSRLNALLDKQIAFLEAQPKGQSYEAQFKIALDAYREVVELAKQLDSELAEITCEVIRYREDEADRDYMADQRSAVSETAPLVAGDLAKQREIHDTYAPVSAIEEREEWLIWSNEHNAWWGPNSCGYNWHADNAGRYTLTEAMKHCTSRSWDDRIPPESMIHISALPKECHEPV